MQLSNVRQVVLDFDVQTQTEWQIFMIVKNQRQKLLLFKTRTYYQDNELVLQTRV